MADMKNPDNRYLFQLLEQPNLEQPNESELYEVCGYSPLLERVGYLYIAAGSSRQAAQMYYNMVLNLHHIDVKNLIGFSSPVIRYNVVHHADGEPTLQRARPDGV